MSTVLETPVGIGPWLADQLRRGHDGDPWHGWPVIRILADVDAARAAARPLPDGHCIWEIVLHMTAWVREAARRMRGGAPAEPAAGDWPAMPEPTPAAWSGAVADLSAAHSELERAIAAFPPARWGERHGEGRDVVAGAGVTFAELVNGVVQHDAYHAGQIALLKKGR